MFINRLGFIMRGMEKYVEEKKITPKEKELRTQPYMTTEVAKILESLKLQGNNLF